VCWYPAELSPRVPLTIQLQPNKQQKLRNTPYRSYFLPNTVHLLSCPGFFLGVLLSLAPAALSAHASAIPRHTRQAAVGKAVYFITNGETNAVVALPIGPDGKLSPGKMTPTGGSGAVALNSDNKPATPDTLVSQGALTIAGNVCLAPHLPPSCLYHFTSSPIPPALD
jgi:hypothetical protein